MSYTPPRRPDSLDAPIWRYLEFGKFVSLLRSKSLFFATHAKLKEKCDKLEGRFPSEYREAAYNSERTRLEMAPLSAAEHEEYARITERAIDDLQHRYVISCWYVNECESLKMFKRFGPVAIRSTTNWLRNSIRGESPSYLGMVEYINYEPGEKEWQAPYMALFHKHKDFEDEKELRAIVTLLGPEKDKGGYFNRVDLLTLIESVWIAPYADKQLKDDVETILKQNGLSEIPVYLSRCVR